MKKYKAYSQIDGWQYKTLDQIMNETWSSGGPNEWFMFSEILDRNGKEIYSNDIVEADFDCEIGYSNEPHKVTGVIVLSPELGWCLDLSHVMMPLSRFDGLKVIGNMTETPEELL